MPDIETEPSILEVLSNSEALSEKVGGADIPLQNVI